MQARGMSLVEMVVAIGIISILLAIGTLKFHAYADRYRKEAQTRKIYTELMKARSRAVSERRGTRVKVYPALFEVYSTTRDDSTGADPAEALPLAFRIVCNAGAGSDESGHPIEFSSNGLANIGTSICLGDNYNDAAVDSVVVSATRLSIGKRGRGKECNSENIAIK